MCKMKNVITRTSFIFFKIWVKFWYCFQAYELNKFLHTLLVSKIPLGHYIGHSEPTSNLPTYLPTYILPLKPTKPTNVKRSMSSSPHQILQKPWLYCNTYIWGKIINHHLNRGLNEGWIEKCNVFMLLKF